jgi:hypothetical protein
MNTYYISSQLLLDEFSTKIQSDNVNIGDIILLNHDALGTNYNLSGVNISGVIPFEIVSKNGVEFDDLSLSSKNSITLMSKDILRYVSFNINEISSNNSYDLSFGDNNWKYSTLKTWLNSNKENIFNDFDFSENAIDLSDDSISLYLNEPGFLYGFDDFISNNIPNIKNKTNVISEKSLTPKEHYFALSSLNDQISNSNLTNFYTYESISNFLPLSTLNDFLISSRTNDKLCKDKIPVSLIRDKINESTLKFIEKEKLTNFLLSSKIDILNENDLNNFLKSSSSSHPSGKIAFNNSVKILFNAKMGPPIKQIKNTIADSHLDNCAQAGRN